MTREQNVRVQAKVCICLRLMMERGRHYDDKEAEEVSVEGDSVIASS